MDYQKLASNYGTPLYVYDFDYISSSYTELKKAFNARKSLICYAVKANSNLSILKFLSSLGAGFDCVSIGEIKKALLAGARSYQVIFSGVGKRADEIQEALENNILMINIESESELKLVEEIAKKINVKARISVRVNPNIEAKTHKYITTGTSHDKFGVDINIAKKIYIYAKNSEFLDPIGIHFHIGSQLNDLKPILDATKIVAGLLRELKSLEIDIKFFDVGGGIGICYENEEEINLYDYAQGILAELYGQDITVVCEPGRYLIGNSGLFLTSVLYEKFSKDKRFVVVDGAMNDFIRPSFYNAKHKVNFLGLKNQESLCDIVGPVCESGDFLAKDVMIDSCQSGDLISIDGAGAYGFSMSSNYNSRLRAAEVAIIEGKDKLIRRREEFQDIVALEKDYL